ncbi:zinc finger CCCH domain-containing protein 19-like [Bidens hawaiensis]|uniref:zinc finger CCCH domain-containing protein 19-like n=1 Tax=Bidens hawaiensis TaxID=980011 RepID=UPI00404B4935
MENVKSLNTETELEAEKPSMETEKPLDTETETEKSLDTEMEHEKSLDTEVENEEEAKTETESSTKRGGGKRKRGKATPTQRKIIEDDVCFICYDGGDLVLCDRRNCPKAYHAACVNRDEAFFQSKGSWTCGWHLCSHCEKKAEYMCYTCTHSLCKACSKTSDMLCVREKEKRGLCSACIKVVMSIEKGQNQGDLNFDDKNSWEHLFKDYWIETKEKHNLTSTELEQAKSFCKDDNVSGSDNPPENLKTRKSKRNTKKHKSNKEDGDSVGPEPENAEWVSKDLLEFVTHMRNDDTSAISQSEVQDMLFEYIKRNKLRDPNHKSQIICDARLENLFGKPRVAHIEMLKLLESHFLVKEDSQIDEVQGTVVDTDISPVNDKDKKRKGRKKSDRRGPQSNREDYAAIDIHNINLIYLRRKLVEDLLDDMEKIHDIIVGTFVRIRISGANQKQDIYRLVQVTGTSEASWYTLSKRTTCTMLEILNLDKKETISIDSISNQDFMEDECKRLRQSIKCGLINRLTVGDVLDKAMELQPVRVNDWFETEIVRLNHLRDRASDLGRKKELRECVEKLNVLKTPEERARRLEEVPLIHEDPTMDPEYGSEDDTDPDDKKQESYKRSDSFRFNRRGDYTSKESWNGTPRGSSGKSHELTESWSGTPRGGSSGKNHEFTESWSGTPRSSSAKNLEFAESWGGTPQSSKSKKYEFSKNLSNKSFPMKAEEATTSFKAHKENSQDPFVQQPIILEKPSVESALKINESEKMWHYKDPSEKIQGPFSMVQLRKWSKNGYFPVGLKIWRKTDKESDGFLLTDALEGKLKVADPRAASQDGQKLTRNLPSPTPNKVNVGWNAGQTGAVPGSGPLTCPNPPLVACGNNDGNLAGSIGVSPFQPHDPSTNTVLVPVAAAGAPQNVDPGVQNPVQSYQLGQPVAPPDGNMQAQMVQSVSGQTPQGWPQNMQQNPSMNMAGLQPMVYNQWPGVPTMVQNPVGNFMPVPQDQWAQQYPFSVNQPTMQQPQQQLQPNLNWGAMAANPNMGWVGPNAGNPMNWAPMVQGPQVTGAVDPNWAMQAGWVGPVPNQSWVATPTQVPVVAGNGNPGWVGPMPPGTNQVAPGAGWVAPNVNQAPTDMNTGWVGGPANQGAPVPNQGWVPPAGNQGPPPPPPGTASPNWGPRNRGGNENLGNHSGPRRNRGGFGSDGNRRSFNNNNNNNQQESFHRDGGSMDNDDGSTRNDGVSAHGDVSRTSDQ